MTHLKFCLFVLISGSSQLSAGCANAGHDKVHESEEPLPGHLSLDPDLELATLTQQQVTELCQWTETASPARAVTCDDGSTVIEPGTSAENCQNQLEELLEPCSATISDHQHCVTLSDCYAEDRSNYCSRVKACAPQ